MKALTKDNYKIMGNEKLNLDRGQEKWSKVTADFRLKLIVTGEGGHFIFHFSGESTRISLQQKNG